MATKQVNASEPVNGMPMVSVEPEPTPFSQAVPEHSSGPVVVVERARVKPTRRSQSRYPKGNTIPLAYVLKVPTAEALFQIYNDYTIIRNLVFTFDREHEESWFEAHPLAVLLPTGTTQRPTRQELRDNYRYYCAALAHYKYYYTVVQNMRIASFINLLQIGRFQGKTRRKDVATIARWSLVNRESADLQAYPSQTGAVNAMADASKFAIGSSANGVTAFAMPLFDTTVYGNLGNHAGSLKDGIVDVKPDVNSAQQSDTFGFGAESSDYALFQAHSAQIISEYYDVKAFDIINASTLVFKGKGTKPDAYISLQRDGRKRYYDSDVRVDTSLTREAWRAYRFWSGVLANQFQAMRDPAHDIRVLFYDLKFVEDTPTNVKLRDLVQNSSFYDITSLRNAMRYMQNGKANTATIVRQSLPLANPSVNDSDDRVRIDVNQKAIFAANVFDVNFHRYKIHEDNAEEWIRDAKKWPGLTPRCFPDSDSKAPSNQAGVIAGAISSDGGVVTVGEGFMNAGKYAYYFDYATHQTLDPAKSIVEFSAVSEDYAREVVENREGFICTEDPSQVFVRYSKFLDCSDPFQCGFFLLNAEPDSAKSEWEQFLSEIDAFPGATSDPEQSKANAPDVLSPFTAKLDGVPISISAKQEPDLPKNTLTAFATMDWYSLLFVGDMPFVLPEARSVAKAFALPVERTIGVNPSDSATANPTTPVGVAHRQKQYLAAAAARDIISLASASDSSKSTSMKNQLKLINRAVNASNFLSILGEKTADGKPVLAEGSSYEFKTFKLGEEVTQLDPTKPKFYVSANQQVVSSGATGAQHLSGNSLPAGADAVGLQILGWQVDTDGDDLATLTGRIVFYAAGKIIESLTREAVTWVASNLVKNKKQKNATHSGTALTSGQVAELQKLSVENENKSTQFGAGWVAFTNWSAKIKELLEDTGSFLQTFIQVKDANSREMDPHGYQLALQIPATQVAQQMKEDTNYSSAATKPVKQAVEQLTEGTVTTDNTTSPQSIFDKDDEAVVPPSSFDALAVWRYAINLVREKSQATRFKTSFQGATPTEKYLNPSAILATLMANSWETEGAVKLYMFNPQFGPVAICVDPIPKDSDYGFDPDTETTDIAINGSAVTEMVPRMGVFQTTGSMSDKANQRNSYQTTQISAHLWRWPVKAFAFQQAKIKNGRPVVQDGDPVRFDDEIKARWPLAMFAQLVVTFAGAGDVRFFANLVSETGSIDKVNVETTSPSEIDGLIFVPAKLLKVPLKTGDNDITGPARTKESEIAKTIKDNYVSSGGSKSSGGNKRKRKNRGGRKSNDTPKDEYPTELTSSVTDTDGKEVEPRAGGPSDISSPEADKKAKRKMSGPSFIAPNMQL